jgi:hypothetical protein
MASSKNDVAGREIERKHRLTGKMAPLASTPTPINVVPIRQPSTGGCAMS